MLRTPKRLLMVYPEFHNTYWGMTHYLPLVGLKASMPPLGLATIAALTPPEYDIRLVDMNCQVLTEEDIAWAEVVLFSAMIVQQESLFRTAKRCRQAGKLVVFGGPYPTACPAECEPHCDAQVLYEGEVTWPGFVRDLEQGTVKPLYTSAEKPDLTRSPCPRFDLLDLSKYKTVPIQFSRGCPYQCEFCDIIVMYGRKPRTKTPEQLIRELEALYRLGRRGSVFIVDDNFIGNKKEVKRLLPALAKWNRDRGNPFYFGTEASVNLADDPELLRQMVEANFRRVFLGIETPSLESLKETRKTQNTLGGSLLDRVQAIQKEGLVVTAGFIVGFDSDGADIFARQIEFITQAAIPISMVGTLEALPGTPLHARMRKEGRLIEEGHPYQDLKTSRYSNNIVTRLPRAAFLAGFRDILVSIYRPEAFLSRTLDALSRLPRRPQAGRSWKWAPRFALFCLWQRRRLPASFRRHSLRLTWMVWSRFPEHFWVMAEHILMGYHFYRFTVTDVLPSLNREIEMLERGLSPRSKDTASRPLGAVAGAIAG